LLPEQFNPELKIADKAAIYFFQQDEHQKKDRLKSTQLRKFFHALKDIERTYKTKKENDPFNFSDVSPVLPELAYALGRELIPREFYDLMKECLSDRKLKTVKDYRRFIEFLTAILAYHKMHKELKDVKSSKGGDR